MQWRETMRGGIALPLYTVLSVDPAGEQIEVYADDVGTLLNGLTTTGERYVDVLVDGDYAFSAQVEDDGQWHVFVRDLDA